VNELQAAFAAGELSELERRLAEEQREVDELKERIRVAEAEIASWKPARKRVLEGGAIQGFVVGLTTTVTIGAIIAGVLAR